jgi:hypothetical protein
MLAISIVSSKAEWMNLLFYSFRAQCSARIFILLRSLRIDSHESILASLCSLAGRYDNPYSTRFLAPIDCSKNSSTGFSRAKENYTAESLRINRENQLFLNKQELIIDKVNVCNLKILHISLPPFRIFFKDVCKGLKFLNFT